MHRALSRSKLIFYNYSDKSHSENSISNHPLTFAIATEKDKSGDIVIAYLTTGSAAYLNGNID